MTSYARRFLGALEPIVSQLWFSPEMFEEGAAVGAEGLQSYFAMRSAPLGRPRPATVAAVFFNWNPTIFEQLDWTTLDPDEVLAARERAVRRSLERHLGDAPRGDISAAVELLKVAVASCRGEGRAMFAANAAMPWPDDGLAGLWHAANLLREYRGDGHIAVLVTHRVDAPEALVLQAPWLEIRPDSIYKLRAWPDEVYIAAHEGLVERGFMTPEGDLTDAGTKFREMIERETDRLADAPFDALGPERCEQLLALLAPFREAIVAVKAVPRGVAGIARGV